MLEMNLGENCLQTNKRTTLKINKVLSIGGSSLRENDDRVVVVCLLSRLNPLRDQLLYKFLALSGLSVQD